MKKWFVLTGILCFFFFCNAQNFEKYFEPKALRINYTHSGNKQTDKIAIKSLQKNDIWSGSLTNLLDTFDYGSHRIEVYDFESKQLIYSRNYSCLFEEYRTTEEGKTKKKSFKETVLCPLPKNKVQIVFYTRTRHSEFEQKVSFDIDPKSVIAIPPKKNYNVVDLHIGNPSHHHAYDILIVPEGYAISDSLSLQRDIKRCKDAIIQCAPFNEYAEKINIRAVEAYSPESGISQETKGVKVNTLLKSAFYCLGLERYLMLDHVWKLHDVCAVAPYDNVLVLCNTTKYGGGGIYNWYATVSDNKHFVYVVVHELGHSIAGLADEYYTSEVSVQDFYPQGMEPREPNITSLINFDAKWKDMMLPQTPIPTPGTKEYENTLGVYEGAGYCAKGLYRPWVSCTMKDLVYNQFCPVCKKAIKQMLDFYAEEENKK